jgi:hypothetical protein
MGGMDKRSLPAKLSKPPIRVIAGVVTMVYNLRSSAKCVLEGSRLRGLKRFGASAFRTATVPLLGILVDLRISEMDFLDVLTIVWIASTGFAAIVGYFRGCGDQAMTLGVLFGPIGLLLTLILLARHGRSGQGETGKSKILRMEQHCGEVAA